MKKELRAIALNLRSTLSLIWNVLFTSVSDELRIWQERDRLGNVWWYVYDPMSRRSIQFPSEQEVRRWLEKRFSNR
jgi:YD repeat-containing protein